MSTFPELLRELDDNERHLLNLLRYGGSVSRQALQERMGLSSSSMHRLTHGLEKMGMIAQLGEGQSGGGRKPVLYGIGNGAGLLIGVELSRTEVRLLICHPNLEPVERMRFSLDATHDPEKTVGTITEHLRAAIQRQGAVPADIPGIGLGTVGILDREQGIIRKTTGFLHDGWQDVPISHMLSECIGIPVHLDNGANMAVLAESLAGSGPGFGTIAYIHLGMGIRTGIFSNGEVLRFIGEPLDAFGHLSVDIHGMQCDCGNRGCMETYGTLPALSRILEYPDASSGNAIQQHLKTLDEYPGEEPARLEQAAIAFGSGLANLVRVTNTRLVILSGPVIRSSHYFYEASTNRAKQQLQAFSESSVQFERNGHFGEWAISTGSAASVLELALRHGSNKESLSTKQRSNNEGLSTKRVNNKDGLTTDSKRAISDNLKRGGRDR